MSKGFGRVQCALIDLFTAIGEKTYSLAELCELVYDQPDEKKHRVAILRAIRGVIDRRHGAHGCGHIGMFRGGKHGTYYVCDETKLEAYALVQMRLWYGGSWWEDGMWFHEDTHGQAVKRLKSELEHPRGAEAVAIKMEPETGLWWLYCAAAKAELDGNKELADKLWKRYAEARTRWLGTFGPPS